MAIEQKGSKEYAGLLTKGLIIVMAPGIAKGIILRVFRDRKVSVEGADNWVQNNTNLWKTLTPDEQVMLKNLAEWAVNINWLDADWVIDAIKGDFPAVASLFLGWRKANNWLKRQCEIIRNEVEG